MEIKLIKTTMIAGILLFTTMSTCAQQENKEEYTVVSIDSIYLENKGKQLSLKDITTKNIRGLLGKPQNIDIYEEKWYDECDKVTTYEYKLLTVRFWSLEKEEWLHAIESLSSDIPVVINSVKLLAGMKDSVLNVFEKSWNVYQELENTKYYQDNVKRGYSEKTLIIKFPIKKYSYEYLGSIHIGIKDRNIVKIDISLQDIDNI
jgi:hypothetical protein